MINAVPKIKIKHRKLKNIKKDLMDLVKAYIKKRDNYTCQHCGKQGLEKHDCQASHVHPDGGGERLSYDPLNMKVLCFRCHTWWHENPTESGEWFKVKFPDRWYYIQQHKNDIVHWKEFDYIQMIENWKRIIKE